jgi:hypothetical protein
MKIISLGTNEMRVHKHCLKKRFVRTKDIFEKKEVFRMLLNKIENIFDKIGVKAPPRRTKVRPNPVNIFTLEEVKGVGISTSYSKIESAQDANMEFAIHHPHGEKELCPLVEACAALESVIFGFTEIDKVIPFILLQKLQNGVYRFYWEILPADQPKIFVLSVLGSI